MSGQAEPTERTFRIPGFKFCAVRAEKAELRGGGVIKEFSFGRNVTVRWCIRVACWSIHNHPTRRNRQYRPAHAIAIAPMTTK
jgi:hypothetical protein